jgi:hypothetical protein
MCELFGGLPDVNVLSSDVWLSSLGNQDLSLAKDHLLDPFPPRTGSEGLLCPDPSEQAFSRTRSDPALSAATLALVGSVEAPVSSR